MEAISFAASLCCLNAHASTILISSSSLLPHSSPRKSFRPSSASASASNPSPPSIRRPDLNRWSNPPSAPTPPAASRSAGTKRRKSDEMELFLELVPSRMRKELAEHGEVRELIEVVMDLGRKPIARFPSGDWVISQEPVNLNDLNHAVSKVGDFSDDNRSGINHSLHRISAIRNRKKQIIGLTCRVGRAISASAEMIRDLVEGGGSILIIGPPGVGKTTVIREIARMLADEHMKRVVIVDTSNEIGGDGDVPHSGIGRARRMQVPKVDMQHSVMIEAVENHMPEVIIIDEIGTELEALAASTIAQRGVQLVGTAHGVTIESIIKNPCLQTLVGGIESVTLGDDEAKRRKVQKTILERKGPPTFTCAVEMVSKTQYRVHHKLEATVDAILAGKSPMIEVRNLTPKSIDSKLPEGHENKELSITNEKDENSEMRTSKGAVDTAVNTMKSSSKSTVPRSSPMIEVRNLTPRAIDSELPGRHNNEELSITNEKYEKSEMRSSNEAVDIAVNTMKSSSKSTVPRSSPVRLYTYKILEADLLQVAQVMGLENDIDITENITTADAILASSSEMKQNPWIRSVAKYHQLPVFVIKANTMAQMVKAVRMILEMNSFESNLHQPVQPVEREIEIEDDAPKRKPTLEEIDALEEVRLAIEYIVIPGGEPVELLPRCSEIIARQLELVESYQLAAEKSGTELNSRLQILPQKLNKKFSRSAAASISSKPHIISSNSLTSENAGASVSRLPLLPE